MTRHGSRVSRAEVFQALTATVTPESADYLFGEVLRRTGLPNQDFYHPEEVLQLSTAMLEFSMELAREAEVDAIRNELFGE